MPMGTSIHIKLTCTILASMGTYPGYIVQGSCYTNPLKCGTWMISQWALARDTTTVSRTKFFLSPTGKGLAYDHNNYVLCAYMYITVHL
jgi:hypothetical protein